MWISSCFRAWVKLWRCFVFPRFLLHSRLLYFRDFHISVILALRSVWHWILDWTMFSEHVWIIRTLLISWNHSETVSNMLKLMILTNFETQLKTIINKHGVRTNEWFLREVYQKAFLGSRLLRIDKRWGLFASVFFSSAKLFCRNICWRMLVCGAALSLLETGAVIWLDIRPAQRSYRMILSNLFRMVRHGSSLSPPPGFRQGLSLFTTCGHEFEP